jgi:hypothetical protein
MSITGPADAVVVTGSITTVGAAREHLAPVDVMRAEEDAAGSGMRTLLVGLGGEGGDLEADVGADDEADDGMSDGRAR